MILGLLITIPGAFILHLCLVQKRDTFLPVSEEVCSVYQEFPQCFNDYLSVLTLRSKGPPYFGDAYSWRHKYGNRAKNTLR